MIKIEIDNKNYEVPGGWEDLTLEEFIILDKWVDIKRPEKLTKLTEVSTEEELKEVQNDLELTDEDEMEFMDFYLQYVEKVSQIPLELLRRADTDEFLELYRVLSYFQYMPTDIDEAPFIAIDGVEYFPDEESTEYLGQQIPMSGMKMGTYRDLMSLNDTFNKHEEGDFSQMDLFMAILYRPKVKVGRWWKKKEIIEPYKEDIAISRKEMWKKVRMDKIWGAYFFLLSSKLKSYNAIRPFLTHHAEKAVSQALS